MGSGLFNAMNASMKKILEGFNSEQSGQILFR